MDYAQTFVVDSAVKRDRVMALLSRLPLDGRMWDVSVKPWHPKRSVDANRRLWALHTLAASSTGHSAEEMHEFCKEKFLPQGTVVVAGEERKISGSTAKLNKAEFREFMERVEAFYISELGVFLGDQ